MTAEEVTGRLFVAFGREIKLAVGAREFPETTVDAVFSAMRPLFPDPREHIELMVDPEGGALVMAKSDIGQRFVESWTQMIIDARRPT